MPLVKICGITRPEDAEEAFSLGADFLGLVFAESKRKIDRRRAGRIMEAVPTFQKFVGVFQNQPLEIVKNTALDLGLEYVQLHGEETSEFCNLLKASGLLIIKAVHIDERTKITEEMFIPYDAHAYLLDTKVGRRSGGTGKAFNWNLVDPTISKKRKIFLSGGLNPENVNNAIDVVRPYAVDVSSGVESELGTKDFRLVREFIKRAKQDIR